MSEPNPAKIPSLSADSGSFWHPERRRRHHRFAFGLLMLFLVVFALLGWQPLSREDWLLENALVFVLVPLLALGYRPLPLSKISYGMIFLFLCLHEVGAHYTYSQVPYDVWWAGVTGSNYEHNLGAVRNHFDRAVHFGYGLLLVYPARELFLRVADAKGFWGYLLPVLLVMSSSLIFEFLEWAAVLVFSGDLGVAYLGTQGDVWDAQKDMLLATLGAVLATLVIAVVHARIDRDFSREWNTSLTVKQPEPLGEVAIDRYLHGGKL